MFWNVLPASQRRAVIAVFAFTLAALTCKTAVADDAPAASASLSPLVISATRIPTPEDELGSSVTVITADDIAKKQLRTLPDVLQSVPGLNVVQSGGIGGVTSVFIRGTNSNHTKVLIDGIDMADPSTPTGAFDFSNLNVADIERIEVLRGPQSGLYGSDAVGGVINIVTKSGKGPAAFSGSAEVGSFGTFNQDASISGSTNRFNYSFNAMHLYSDDTPVTPTDLLPAGQNRTANSYDNKTYSTKLGAKVSDDWDAGLVARYIESDLRFIGSNFNVTPNVPDTQRSQNTTKQLFTRGTAHTQSFDGLLDQTFGLSYTEYKRTSFSPSSTPSLSISNGDRLKEDWQGNIGLADNQVLVMGLENQSEELHTTAITPSTDTQAGSVELQSSFDDILFNSISVRHDRNSRFGGDNTYRIAPSIHVPNSGLRLKGSLGTAFKAPSLNDLFVDDVPDNFFSNPNLKPEKSIGYDAGFDQTLLDKRLQFGSTYFHNSIKNLITTNDAFTTNINVGKAETYGFENFVSVKPESDLTLRADYTYTIANDEVKHQELLRRPKHKASLTGTWQATPVAMLSATALYVGSWIDTDRYGNISRLKSDGYTVFNLAGTYDLGDGVTAFARIDNLFDKTYQDPVGFDRPGLGVFAGIRVNFGFADLAK